MGSPFPGMDPYIESARLWPDFHVRVIAGLSSELSRLIPEQYIIRAEERIYVDMLDDDDRYHGDADIAVVSPQPEPVGTLSRTSAEPGEAGKPVLIPAKVEMEFKEHFLEIRLAKNNRIVTVVEILSPANKRPGSEGYAVYNRKREAYLLGRVNLVEIDLLRAGKRPPMAKPWPECDFYVMVARAGRWKACEIWPISLRRRLPAIAFPLTSEDSDVRVELQPIVDRAYGESRYHHSIRYDAPLRPKPDADTANWIETVLAR